MHLDCEWTSDMHITLVSGCSVDGIACIRKTRPFKETSFTIKLISNLSQQWSVENKKPYLVL